MAIILGVFPGTMFSIMEASTTQLVDTLQVGYENAAAAMDQLQAAR